LIIKKLRAVNFKSLQDETIDFRNGVTLIRGLNESGKSTIMEAILYALYGYALRPKMNPPKAKLIEYDSPRALVQLAFEIAGKTYQVTREIHRSDKRSSKSSVVEILQNGKSVPKGVQSVTEVTNTVKSLMGEISYHELVSSCVVAQKELGKLVGLRAGDRKDIINVFLNLEHFNEITDKVKDRRRDLLGKRESGGGRIDSEKVKLEGLNSELELYDNNSSEKDEKSGELVTLQISLDVSSSELTAKDSLLEKLEEFHKTWLTKRELKLTISGLENQLEIQSERLDKLEGLETTRMEIQSQLDGLDYVETASANIPDIKEYVQKHGNLDQRIIPLTETKNEQMEKREKQVSTTEKVRPTPKEQKILSSSVSLRIVAILVVVVSLLCVLGVTINILLLLASIPFILLMVYVIYKFMRRVRLSEKNSTFLQEEERLQTLSENLEGTQDQIRRIESEMGLIVQNLESEFESLPPKFKEMWIEPSIECASKILEDYKQRNKEREDLQTNLVNTNEQLKEKPDIEKKVTNLKQEIESGTTRNEGIVFPELPDGIEFSEEFLKETNDGATDLRISIAAIKQQIKDIETRISELEIHLEKHERIHQEYDAQKAKVDGLIEEEKITGVIRDALETTSENLRKRVRPNVERYMQQILPVITDNRYKAARLSDEYDVEVWSDNAGEFQEKEMFSGGTEDQFLLAMRVAFALALLPLRKYTRPEFLFLDEPLGSSDVVRREGIMNLTQTILAESFQQIIIISHVEGLEDYIDNIIEVEEGRVITP